jgi:CRP/FNR family transcriptional regulator, cyclic AMP receptor protein
MLLMEYWLSLGELERLLAMVEVLEPLPPREVRKLASSCRVSRLEVGETMFVDPETHAQRTILLLAGRARVCEERSHSRTLTVSVAEAGSVVETTGLAHRPRGLTIEAVIPSMLCFVARENFEGLLRRNPEVGLRLLGVLGDRIVVLEERLMDLAHKEVTARLAGTIVRLVDSEGVVTPQCRKILTRYTHQQLASMIGSNRASTTRALRRLRDEGLIEVRKRCIHVTDMAGLGRVANEEESRRSDPLLAPIHPTRSQGKVTERRRLAKVGSR